MGGVSPANGGKGGAGRWGGGIWGATPRNFLKIKLTLLSCNVGHFVVALIKFLKVIFFIVCGNKSAVWCSRGIVLMFGGMGATPGKIFKKLPLFPAI